MWALTSTDHKEVESEASAACNGRHEGGLARGEGGEQAGAEADFVQVARRRIGVKEDGQAHEALLFP